MITKIFAELVVMIHRQHTTQMAITNFMLFIIFDRVDNDGNNERCRLTINDTAPYKIVLFRII